jgi:type I restriction enzyme R subunit
MDDVNSKELLNTAIEDVVFTFTKTGEEELKLLSEDLHNYAGKVRSELDKNYNQTDPQWITLYEAFIDLLEKHNIDPNSESIENMKFESAELKKIFEQIKELNRENALLLDKFDGDIKIAKIFKNNEPSGKVSANLPLYNLLSSAKHKIDDRLTKLNLLNNPGFFRQAVGEDIINVFESSEYKINSGIVAGLITQTADEYLKEYKGE